MQKLRSETRLVICKPASLQIPILLACILFLNFSLVCPAAIIRVPENNSTIQSAIDAAFDGDEIIVSPGTYYENINFNGKNIILRSTDPTSPTVVASTIIDGQKTSCVVRFKGTESPSCVLSGFTITNGMAPSGGGIKGNGTLATIENNNITTNTADGSYPDGYGGGLYHCNGTIQNNTISGNSAGHGGGLSDCNGIIQNNTISGNSAYGGGGLSDCNGIIQKNTISGNSATSGAGLLDCDGTIHNNTIAGNSGNDGGGLFWCDGIIQSNTITGNSAKYAGSGFSGCGGFIINCIIWGNSTDPWGSTFYESTTPFYSCIQDWTGGGRGNISADPRFVDPANGDYHLQPGSPCIDAGSTYYLLKDYIIDVDGECRLAGSSVDMGSDEYGSSIDSDGDLMADNDEATQGSNPDNPDSDGDGLRDGAEVLRGTNPTQYNIPSGISIPADYTRIQQGLFLAFPGEVITVSPGTYYENLNFLGKNLILQSTNPFNANIVNNTIIDGDRLFSVIFFNGTEDSTCAVRGFTIRDGSAYIAGGIRGNGTLAKIKNNKILDNSADHGGGLYDCDGTIQNNTIYGNSAIGVIKRSGGGLYDCDGIIQNNIISGNSTHYGGGLSDCDGIIQNNIVSNNSVTGEGGGLYNCDGLIQNTVIYGNGYHTLSKCAGPIVNCIIWGNSGTASWQLYHSSTPIYSCIEGWTEAGRGNISTDPKFVAPVNGDFHLLPDSPCIDAGNTHYLSGEYIADIDGECRLAGSSVDMGCDEYGSSIDTDGDLLADMDEDTSGTNRNVSDTDGDGLKDGLEVLRGTSPTVYDTPSGNYIPAQYPSIQQGIFLAFPSEVITVSPGIYKESVLFLGKNLVLQSTNPLDDSIVSSTIVDGEELFFVISFTGMENDTYIIKGLTLRNGYAIKGGAICGNGTRATIANNKILDNEAQYFGGGLFKCEGVINDNIISNNTVRQVFGSGGGLYECDGPIHYNTISKNSAEYGGGLYRCDGIIQHNTISSNRGGGLYQCSGPILNNIISGNSGSGLYQCEGLIQNNSILHNSARGGGGLYGCNGTIQNNIISDNSGRYSGGGLLVCDGTIQNNTIASNTASWGGGLGSCQGTIQNNLIYGNSVRGGEYYLSGVSYRHGIMQTDIESLLPPPPPIVAKGGGLYKCNGIIQNNIISSNLALIDYDSGGGLSYCDGIIQNNIVSMNSASWHGGGLYECYGTILNNTIYGNSALANGGGLYNCDAIIKNCIIWQNNAPSGPQLHDNCSTPSYSCIQDWTGGGIGDISDNPELVDPANGDFHLKTTSPCIDAGAYIADLPEDFEGNPRPWDGTSEPRGDGSDFDIGADEYIGPISFDFSMSREEWKSGSAIVFSEPQFIFEPGRLKLVSQNNTNTFGFWNSPENAIPVTKGYLYRARFIVSTDVALPELVPQIRLRVNSSNFQQADCLIIDSNGDGGASPTPEGTSYDLYFVPPANEQFCMLAFDLVNFTSNDAPDAELALDSVLIDRFRLDTLDESTTITWAYDFETSQEFWSTGDGTPEFTDPEFFWADGALHLRSTTNTNTFGYWGSDPTDITIEENRLYRGTFEVRTDETDRSRVPQMRLRFNTANMQAARSFEIASAGDGANSPGITNTTYDRLYFLPPANCVGRGLIVSFDILNFNPGDAPTASLILDRAIIETLSPPALP